MSDNYRGVTLWFTGLSQAGKTTISSIVAEKLRARGVDRLETLDGDVMRMGLCQGLGFTKEDRDENVRRHYLVAQLLTRNNVVTMCALISPYREARETARALIGDFVEIYCEAPLEVCAERDTKGFYAKAMAGEIANFTGVSDPYEAPENPEITLRTDQGTAEQHADTVIKYLEDNGFLKPENDRELASASS